MLMRTRLLPPALAALLALPAAGAAQARGAGTRDTVPVSLLPPAGKCRVWMVGVPAAQQPAPTDCATALRQKPANGVLLYGPASREPETERFDPKVGREAPAKVERDGSAAEQELRRERERAARERRAQELRERDERARREQEERRLNSGSGPRTPVTTIRTPTVGGSNGTGSSGTSGTAKPAPTQPAPKAPERPRKPE